MTYPLCLLKILLLFLFISYFFKLLTNNNSINTDNNNDNDNNNNHNGKWFEPRSLSRLCGLIVRVRVVPRTLTDVSQPIYLSNDTDNNVN